MLKKYRQAIIGFVLGAVIFGAFAVSAGNVAGNNTSNVNIVGETSQLEEFILYRSECRLNIDGEFYDNEELPLLNYKGQTYIPSDAFEKICNQVGVDFNWISELKQIQVEIGDKIPTLPVKEEPTVSEPYIDENGINVSVFDGVEYVSIFQVRQVIDNYLKDIPHFYTFDKENKTLMINDTLLGGARLPDEFATLNIPLFYPDGTQHIKYDFFIENILPLPKK